MSACHIAEHDPPRWIDLDLREQMQLCCDVIEGNVDFLVDALTQVPFSELVTLLRERKHEAIGALLSASVLENCRREVERRLDAGDFNP